MRINSLSNSNINFKARLSGDISSLWQVSKQKGLPKDLFALTLNNIKKAVPDKNVVIKLYNREVAMRLNNNPDPHKAFLLQKVKFLKNHEVIAEQTLEANTKYAIAKYLSVTKQLAKKLT